MADVTVAFEEELEDEVRTATAQALVWIAVAAGIGMAIVQAIRSFKKKRAGETDGA